jgi:hypothetical protein
MTLTVTAVIFCIVLPRLSLLGIMGWILLAILFSFNTDNADRLVHETKFEYATIGDTRNEPLFNLVIEISRNAGLDYQQFLIIVGFTFTGILAITVRKFTRANIVPYLLLLFPFSIYTCIIRYTCGLIFVIPAVAIIFSYNKTKLKLGIAAILIIAGTLMHYSLIISLIAFLGLIREKAKFRILLITLISIEIISVVSFSVIVNLIPQTLESVVYKVSGGISWTERFDLEGLTRVAILIFLHYLLVAAFIKVLHVSSGVVGDHASTSTISIMKRINLASLLLIPLNFVTVDAYRVLIALAPIYLAVMINSTSYWSEISPISGMGKENDGSDRATSVYGNMSLYSGESIVPKWILPFFPILYSISSFILFLVSRENFWVNVFLAMLNNNSVFDI